MNRDPALVLPALPHVRRGDRPGLQVSHAVKTEEVSAYSENTGKTYDNWDALVAAEANGYVVVLTTTRTDTVPWVVGPYVSKQEATKARIRLRRKAQKEEAGYKVSTLIRVLWKEKP